MPIKPENAVRYPKNWKEIRQRILARAGHKCELCGIENYAQRINRQGASIKVVLTIAHLNHTPEDCSDDNLRAWCQKCHLAYDHEHHQRNAHNTRRNRKAIGDLLT